MLPLLVRTEKEYRAWPPTTNNRTEYMKPLLSATGQQVAEDCGLQAKGNKWGEPEDHPRQKVDDLLSWGDKDWIRGGWGSWNWQSRVSERRELCASRASEMWIGSSLNLCLSIKLCFRRLTPWSWARNARPNGGPVPSSHTGRVSSHNGGIQWRSPKMPFRSRAKVARK